MEDSSKEDSSSDDSMASAKTSMSLRCRSNVSYVANDSSPSEASSDYRLKKRLSELLSEDSGSDKEFVPETPKRKSLTATPRNSSEIKPISTKKRPCSETSGTETAARRRGRPRKAPKPTRKETPKKRKNTQAEALSSDSSSNSEDVFASRRTANLSPWIRPKVIDIRTKTDLESSDSSSDFEIFDSSDPRPETSDEDSDGYASAGKSVGLVYHPNRFFNRQGSRLRFDVLFKRMRKPSFRRRKCPTEPMLGKEALPIEMLLRVPSCVNRIKFLLPLKTSRGRFLDYIVRERSQRIKGRRRNLFKMVDQVLLRLYSEGRIVEYGNLLRHIFDGNLILYTMVPPLIHEHAVEFLVEHLINYQFSVKPDFNCLVDILTEVSTLISKMGLRNITMYFYRLLLHHGYISELGCIQSILNRMKRLRPRNPDAIKKFEQKYRDIYQYNICYNILSLNLYNDRDAKTDDSIHSPSSNSSRKTALQRDIETFESLASSLPVETLVGMLQPIAYHIMNCSSIEDGVEWLCKFCDDFPREIKVYSALLSFLRTHSNDDRLLVACLENISNKFEVTDHVVEFCKLNLSSNVDLDESFDSVDSTVNASIADKPDSHGPGKTPIKHEEADSKLHEDVVRRIVKYIEHNTNRDCCNEDVADDNPINPHYAWSLLVDSTRSLMRNDDGIRILRKMLEPLFPEWFNMVTYHYCSNPRTVAKQVIFFDMCFGREHNLRAKLMQKLRNLCGLATNQRLSNSSEAYVRGLDLEINSYCPSVTTSPILGTSTMPPRGNFKGSKRSKDATKTFERDILDYTSRVMYPG